MSSRSSQEGLVYKGLNTSDLLVQRGQPLPRTVMTPAAKAAKATKSSLVATSAGFASVDLHPKP